MITTTDLTIAFQVVCTMLASVPFGFFCLVFVPSWLDEVKDFLFSFVGATKTHTPTWMAPVRGAYAAAQKSCNLQESISSETVLLAAAVIVAHVLLFSLERLYTRQYLLLERGDRIVRLKQKSESS
eukprot:PhM_4_TR13252/c0_g1_i1/m.100934